METVFISLSGIFLLVILVLLFLYYRTLKKLRKYAEIEKGGEKILDHGIERELAKFREELETVKESMRKERGILKRIRKIFRR